MPKVITITLTDEQVKLLYHELFDIEQWVKDAIDGRITYCQNVLAEEAQRVLMADPAVTTMPAKPDALVAAYLQRPDYKDRKHRDEDERATRSRTKTT